MPATIPDGVEPKSSVALDDEVAAAAEPVIAVKNDTISPFATAATAFVASVTVVPVIEDTVPTARPVVTS
jgi:hypothetical protein